MKVTIVCLVVGAVVVAPPMRAQDGPPVVRKLAEAWSLPGPWMSVAWDENRAVIYALGLGRGVEVDVTGKIQREIKLPPDCGPGLRMARLPGTTLLTFCIRSADLSAFDLNGNRLWSYPRASGINDVWAADLDSDRSDEVIVGYNGFTGVHVLDGKGRLLWRSTSIGNVWSVSAGDVLREGTSQVVTTSGRGAVHVFSSDGKKRVDLDAGLYPFMVRVRVNDRGATTFVTGSARDGRPGANPTLVTALSGDGANKWTRELAEDQATSLFRSVFTASTEPWLALGTQSGRVYVIDTDRGEIIGRLDAQGLGQVGWAGEPPLLLVATGSALNAFRLMAAN